MIPCMYCTIHCLCHNWEFNFLKWVKKGGNRSKFHSERNYYLQNCYFNQFNDYFFSFFLSGTTLRGDIGVVPSSSFKCLEPSSCFPAVVQPLSSCCPAVVQLLSSRCPAVGTSIQNWWFEENDFPWTYLIS